MTVSQLITSVSKHC